MNYRSSIPDMSRLLTRGTILVVVVRVVGAMAADRMTATLVPVRPVSAIPFAEKGNLTITDRVG